MYGSLWSDRWAGLPPQRVMQTWAEDLADITVDELKLGLSACKTRPFPPTLPEFRSMCRPPLNPQGAYLEAVEQMVRRQTGDDVWSSPVVFWAAAMCGNDIHNHTFEQMKGHWTRNLENAERMIAEGRLPNSVPQRQEALPPPESVVDAKARLAEVRERMARLAESKRVDA